MELKSKVLPFPPVHTGVDVAAATKISRDPPQTF